MRIAGEVETVDYAAIHCPVVREIGAVYLQSAIVENNRAAVEASEYI